jgi:protein-S-isoprenylcysteine O-methyltransferase Ste14
MLAALELKVPPVVVAAACAGAMWFAGSRLPSLGLPVPARAAFGALLAVAGAAVAIAGVAAFRRRGTTVDPTRPEAASALVSEGVYRWTRNPMYLGLAVALAGWAWWLANAAAMALVAGFVAWIDRLQIVPEERALRRKFGAGFDRYAARVSRWI